MLARRLLMIVISLVIGYGATFLIVELLLNTTVAEYWLGPEQPVQIPYFILTGFFIGLAVAIWLDKFMGTEILPK